MKNLSILGAATSRVIVLSRSFEVGKATGRTRRCQLHGCTGLRIGVRWKDKSISWPCSKAMEMLDYEGVQALKIV